MLVFGGTATGPLSPSTSSPRSVCSSPSAFDVHARAARVRLGAILRLHGDPARAFDRDVESASRSDMQRALRVVETDAAATVLTRLG